MTIVVLANPYWRSRSLRSVRRGAAALALALVAATSAFAQTFTNVTAAAGIAHNAIPPACPDCAPTFQEEQSGGVAVGDFDRDGWPDVYVTRYWDSDILYRNNHDGTFSNVTAAAFPGGIGVHDSNGAAWGDVNNDGFLDLAVTTIDESRHLLYINDGVGHFTEEGAARGFTISGGLPKTSGTSVSWGDYDRDGFLDMYVGEWRGFSTNSSPSQARLFRNLGAASPGHFVDVTAAAGVSMDRTTTPSPNKALSFTPKFSDIDRDGRTDLAVISDGKTTRVFWGNGNGTFTDGTAVAGVTTGTNDMGFALADLNGDGLEDWFATSIYNQAVLPLGNRLYLNDGDRTFTDVSQAAGITQGGWGWGADAFDYNNDGLTDLVHTNGMGIFDPDQSVLFKNVGTRTNPQFSNVATAAGITDADLGRGLATFDYDRDGDQDLFIVNYQSAPILYRNDGGNAAGDWLSIRTVGSQSNRDGVGALVTVTPDLAHPEVSYVQEIDGSSNYLSQSEITAHFGLGDVAQIAKIEVLWPSGYRQQFTGLAPNQFLTIAEGLLADFNGDDTVDGLDLAAWAAHAGLATGALTTQGDADRDGDVDGADLLLWQRQLGRTVPSGILGMAVFSPVPEPESLLVLVPLAAAPLRRGGRFRAC